MTYKGLPKVAYKPRPANLLAQDKFFEKSKDKTFEKDTLRAKWAMYLNVGVALFNIGIWLLMGGLWFVHIPCAALNILIAMKLRITLKEAEDVQNDNRYRPEDK